jgi:hypothetical protein
VGHADKWRLWSFKQGGGWRSCPMFSF